MWTTLPTPPVAAPEASGRGTHNRETLRQGSAGRVASPSGPAIRTPARTGDGGWGDVRGEGRDVGRSGIAGADNAASVGLRPSCRCHLHRPTATPEAAAAAMLIPPRCLLPHLCLYIDADLLPLLHPEIPETMAGKNPSTEVAVVLHLLVLVAWCATAASSAKPKVCDKGWECKNSVYCCNGTISDFFQVYQFENLFSKRNTPVALAVGFWDYHSFITAAAVYQPLGFGTTGGKQTQMREVAAFLGHVGSKTSCKDPLLHAPPCTGLLSLMLSVCWCRNYNYGAIGDGLKVDLLNHPEYLEQNATLAFQAAIYRWMTPMKKKQPSAHDVFVGKWKPSKNDTLAKRLPGFGATMNVLQGDQVCGQGPVDDMNNIISHYQYYLDLIGVGRQYSGDNLDCAEQEAFNPSSSSTSSGTT
ncbi:hypothetical protein B296_00054126 [Ensete ventricosum]|uniref:chitinase n=1 Tax=Ensete ventricosum TaxID=4639 RepID=A0A426X206_ENSVE|nr:hypothetical protein B296_00054126 [Ensete ventricosum]